MNSAPSIPFAVVVGLVLVAASAMVLWFAVIFDRQMRQKRRGDEETDHV